LKVKFKRFYYIIANIYFKISHAARAALYIHRYTVLLRLVDMLPKELSSLWSDLLDNPKTLQGDDIMPDEEQRDLDLGLIRPKASVSIL
jgi:hypothetical protein